MYQTRSLTLNLGLRRTFQWIFMVANVRSPILGADFFKHYGLVGDMGHKQITDTRTNPYVQGVTCISSSLSPSPSLLPQQPINDFTAIVLDFPTITLLCSKDHPIKHDITHHIETTGAPVSAHPQRLTPEQLKSAQQDMSSSNICWS